MAKLPHFDAGNFQSGAPIDNPYFPLKPGTVLSYQGPDTDPESGEVTIERDDVFTTQATTRIRGVDVTVVRDTVYDHDLIAEDTFDFYAQDQRGNVWYLGERSLAYDFDDGGAFEGTSTEGQWNADQPGASPGILMTASHDVGPAIYQEFAPGVAEDESMIVARGLTVKSPTATYHDVIQTIDSSALEDGVEYKFYAPGIGNIAEKELAPDGSTLSTTDLYRIADLGREPGGNDRFAELAGLSEGRAVGNAAEIHNLDPAKFADPDARMHVAVIGGTTNGVDALGGYLVDASTGRISNARILASDLSHTPLGALDVEVPDGKTLGLFLVRAADEIGVDLKAYRDGGLRVTDLLTGTAATLDDPYAVTVTDARGHILPIQPLSALGSENGVNTLNPAGSLNAIGLHSHAADAAGVQLIGFEDRLNSDPAYDGDFNDAIVAVSGDPISHGLLRHLRHEAGAGATYEPVLHPYLDAGQPEGFDLL